MTCFFLFWNVTNYWSIKLNIFMIHPPPNIILVTSYYCCTFLFLALPRDCSDICGGNAVFQIFPNTSDPNGFDVYCAFGSDGNIWTVRILIRVEAIFVQISTPHTHIYNIYFMGEWNIFFWYHRVKLSVHISTNWLWRQIREITKLPNIEQSSKGKGKTHWLTNRQNQSTIGQLGEPQWSWLSTGISKEMVVLIRFYGAKPPASITVKRFRMSL